MRIEIESHGGMSCIFQRIAVSPGGLKVLQGLVAQKHQTKCEGSTIVLPYPGGEAWDQPTR